MQTLKLKRGEDRRLKAGHLWIFSNEVDTRATDFKNLVPGEEVLVRDCQGHVLGCATVNPHSLICARIHARSARPLDEELLSERLEQALSLRSALFAEPYYRLVYGEGDALPGLVIDRFGSHLTVQITTLAMEQRKEALRSVLHRLIRPESILWDNTVASRTLEGLALGTECEGPVPDALDVPENDCVCTVPLLEGQKTGWFYDQRPNRRLMERLARGRDVLDAFSYVGGFGVVAGHAGAASVTFADASARALGYAKDNLARNAPQTACTVLEGDAFDTLRRLHDEGRRFFVVSIDPPAFIKRRKDYKEGLVAYRRINALACSLVEDGGYLLTSSCSQALHVDDLRGCVAHACARQGLHPRLLHTGWQGPDHPIHCAMPETAYLKCLLVQISRQPQPNTRPAQAANV